MICMSKAFLSNIARLGVLPISEKKKSKKYRCRVSSRSWVLGVFEPLVGLQDIWDNDKNVLPRVFKQLTTTSWKQSMANTLNKSKL